MTLGEWLIIRGMKHCEFAKRVKVTPTAVNLWLTGKRCPNYRNYLKIKEVTNGEVQYEEFFKT